MKKPVPELDYRKLRLSNLNTKEYRHLWLLLYWPIYGLMFLFVERFYPVESYYPVHCVLDDYIPFVEWFLIPYLFWFLFMVGMHIYTLLYDVSTFRKMMYYTILTNTLTIFIYLVFPTCQNLRPAEFERDNFLTWIMGQYYILDTNTNVCPSLHVIGALGMMFTGWHSKYLEHPAWKIAFTVTGVLISISTVFLKQHSAVDVLVALPISVIAYLICFRPFSKKKKEAVSVPGNPETC